MTTSGTTIVYRATNLMNGKCYIGVTGRGLRKRESEHRYDAKRGKQSALCRAIRAYRVEDIVFTEVAQFGDDYELAMLFEAEIVAKERPEYNLVPGGLNRVGPISEETLTRMRDSHKGKASPRKGVKTSPEIAAKLRGQKRTAEQRARMSAAHAGKPRPWRIGTRHSEETREKLRVARTGKVGPWAGKARPEAAVWLSAANRGRTPWNFGAPLSDAVKDKISLKRKGVTPVETPRMRATRVENMRKASVARRRAIVCVEDGRVFDSVSAAAVFYGVDKGNVYRAAKKYPLHTAAAGKHFRFEVAS